MIPYKIEKNLVLIIASLLLAGCTTTKNKQSDLSNNFFKVEVLQNGKIVPKKNDVITLEKEPFKLKITLYTVTGIDVSASWGKYYYDYPDAQNIYKCEDDVHFEECRFVAIKTGAEDRFNKNKDIYVGDGSYQCHWYYEPELDHHRFDNNVQVINGITHALVTVENIFDLDKRDAKAPKEEYDYPVENINQTFYMVFAASHYESGMEMPDELQREKFTVKFK